MNANVYTLLSVVLRDWPSVDTSLRSTVETVPFAFRCIVEQAFYTMYVVSSTRALLYNDRSAYSQTVQLLVEKQQQQDQPPLPIARRTEGSLPPLSDRSTASAGPDAPLMLEVPLVAQCGEALLPVTPSYSLDLTITLVGGGTVVRQLLHLLLDEHPSFVHPTRITVITRQPENLNVFASRGVVCLQRKHGTEALKRCHVLFLACQPTQLDDFISTHFSSKAFGNDPLHQVATLRRSTLVVSCIAAFPCHRLAAMLHHDPRLVVQVVVPVTAPLPDLAEVHEEREQECLKTRVQAMADQNSFLKEAVMEAEKHRVEEEVKAILAANSNNSNAKRNIDSAGDEKVDDRGSVPIDIARRAALHAVREKDLEAASSKTISKCLEECDEIVAPSFFASVWEAVEAYVAVEFEIKERDRAAVKARSGAGSLASPSASRATSKNEAQSAAKKSEGPFLCAALACLPASVHTAVVDSVVMRYRPPTPHADLFARSHCGDSLTSRITTNSCEKKSLLSGVSPSAFRRLTHVFSDEKSFIARLQERFNAIVASDAGNNQAVF